jgi:hypothetical protein
VGREASRATTLGDLEKTSAAPEKEQPQLIKPSWPKFVKANTAFLEDD